MNNKATDQQAHLSSLISTSCVRCLDGIIPPFLYHEFQAYAPHMHGVQPRMNSVVIFFVFLRLFFFCFVVAICDLVQAVEAMYGLL